MLWRDSSFAYDQLPVWNLGRYCWSIVKWNKEAWGWNTGQLSMLTARSQQGGSSIHPHIPPLFYSWPQKLQKSPQTIDLVEPHPLSNIVYEAAPSVRRRSSLGLAFVVNTRWDVMLRPPTSSHVIQFNCTNNSNLCKNLQDIHEQSHIVLGIV